MHAIGDSRSLKSAERLPRPVVVGAAHGWLNAGVRRRPDRQALVGEQDLGVAAVERQVGDAVLGRAARLVAQLLVALERLDPVQLGLAEALGLLVLLAVALEHDAGQAVVVLLGHALARRCGGSCTWPSADTMKNLSAASGRADRTQPSLPGVAVRQTLLTSGSRNRRRHRVSSLSVMMKWVGSRFADRRYRGPAPFRVHRWRRIRRGAAFALSSTFDLTADQVSG